MAVIEAPPLDDVLTEPGTPEPIANTPDLFVIEDLGGPPEPPRKGARWPWVMAVVAFVEFIAAGWWMLYVKQYELGDATTRTLNAKLMVLSADPHIAAIGFYWMPIPTFTRIPFVLLLQPFGYAALAGPATSALFSALTIPILAAAGRVLGAPRWLVVTVCALFAVSPLTIFMSANAMSESTFGCFIALSLLGYARWSRSHEVWDLVIFGFAVALAVATRYEMLIVAPVLCAGAAIQLSRNRWLETFTLAMIPTMLTAGAWGVASKLIMNDWIFFLHASSGLTHVPADASWLPANRTLAASFAYSGVLVAVIAPGIVMAVAGLQRNFRATSGLLASAVALPVVSAYQVHTGTSWAVPRFYMVLAIFSFFSVMWGASTPHNPTLAVDRPRRRTSNGVAFAGVIVVILGVILGTLHLAVPKHTKPEGEYIFFRYLLGRDTASTPIVDGPNQLFESNLRQYYVLRDELDPLLATGKKVASDVSNFETLITRYPKQYVVPENRDFKAVSADPAGRFDFIVVVKSSALSSDGYTLRSIVTGVSRSGTWIKTRDYVNLTLWEYVPTGKQPTTGPDAVTQAKGSPANVANGTNASTTPTGSTAATSSSIKSSSPGP